MKVKVNQEACIGCGACCSYSDNVFEINDDGVSTVKTDKVPEKDEQAVKDAIEACPTAAIEEVKNDGTSTAENVKGSKTPRNDEQVAA